MGKVGNVIDTSILNIKDAAKARVETNLKEGVKNDQAFLDLTDFQNEDFVYVLWRDENCLGYSMCLFVCLFVVYVVYEYI